MYFDNFQKFLYDFDLGSSQKFLLVTDITKNIRFKKDFIDNIQLYETYKMNDGESIEMVSEKIYGSPDYHWVLMLLNQRYDYVEDFAVDSATLDQMIERKYGDRKTDVVHYLDESGFVTNPSLTITMVNTPHPIAVNRPLFGDMEVGNVIRRKTSIGDYTARFDGFTADNDLRITMTNGNFKIGDTVTVYKYYDDVNGNFVEEAIGTSKILNVTIPEVYTPITNYEKEYYANEKKRIIKIVPQAYMQQILSEFDTLMQQ